MSTQLQLPQELKTKQNHCDEQQKISHAFQFIPFTPKISLVILHTVSHTVFLTLVQRFLVLDQLLSSY